MLHTYMAVVCMLWHLFMTALGCAVAGAVCALAGVIEVAEGMDERVCRTNPIRCRVSGGYTISKQTGYGADSSPETLLTCILQVSGQPA